MLEFSRQRRLQATSSGSLSSASNSSSMLVYDVAASSPTSSAVTSAALTFGQAQMLLADSTALDNEILAIAAVAVCGNGVCELGERPNATAAGVNATGTHSMEQDAGHVVCLTVVHACLSKQHWSFLQPRLVHKTKQHIATVRRPGLHEESICGTDQCTQGFRMEPQADTVGSPHHTSLSGAGGCPTDCLIPYVACPIPSGSLSMCSGTPSSQCTQA